MRDRRLQRRAVGDLPAGAAPGPIALDATNMYWLGTGGQLLYLSLDRMRRRDRLDANAQGSGSLALRGADAYWVSGGPSGSIMQCAIADCSNTTTALVTNLSQPRSIAVDATNVYFTYVGGVGRCAVGGCADHPATVATGDTPYGVVVDAAKVYWVDKGAGTVSSCPVAGCTSPTLLASGQSGLDQIAIDAVSVYWTNTAYSPLESTIVRMAKPIAAAVPPASDAGCTSAAPPRGLTLSTASLGFSGVGCNGADGTSSPAPDTVTITNSNPVPVTWTASLSGNYFALDTTGSTLAAGASVAVAVTAVAVPGYPPSEAIYDDSHGDPGQPSGQHADRRCARDVRRLLL